MGSWNYRCAISGLPMLSGDKCVVLIMVAQHHSGYFNGSISFKPSDNLSPIMPPIKAAYNDYGDFEFEFENFAHSSHEDMLNVLMSQCKVSSSDRNDYDGSIGSFMEHLASLDTHISHICREKYWYHARSDRNTDGLPDKRITYFDHAVKSVVVLQRVWDMMLYKMDLEFYSRGQFNFHDVDVMIDGAMDNPLSAVTGTLGRYSTGSYGYDPMSPGGMFQQFFMNGMTGEGGTRGRLYRDNRSERSDEFNLCDPSDFIREYWNDRGCKEIVDESFEPWGMYHQVSSKEGDKDELKTWFKLWAQYEYVNSVMRDLGRCWTTVCGAGSQHENHMVVSQFCSNLGVIASKMWMERHMEDPEETDEVKAGDLLRSQCEAMLENDPDEKFDNQYPRKDGDEGVYKRHWTFLTLKKTEVELEVNHDHSDGLHEALFKTYLDGHDLNDLVGIFVKKNNSHKG